MGFVWRPLTKIAYKMAATRLSANPSDVVVTLSYF